jgi:hypothetical protein
MGDETRTDGTDDLQNSGLEHPDHPHQSFAITHINTAINVVNAINNGHHSTIPTFKTVPSTSRTMAHTAKSTYSPTATFPVPPLMSGTAYCHHHIITNNSSNSCCNHF